MVDTQNWKIPDIFKAFLYDLQINLNSAEED